ncbi:MAG: hypothetical protein ACQEWW_07760 [Bacillota bacterium]
MFFTHESSYIRTIKLIESLNFIITEQTVLIKEQRNLINDLKEQILQIEDNQNE